MDNYSKGRATSLKIYFYSIISVGYGHQEMIEVKKR